MRNNFSMLASVTSAPAEPIKPTNVRSSYRPDIDGLRAIAVLAVLAVHTDVLPGGFVGVDIFFVISGYLISGIILRALARGDFSIFEFYTRRAKRIFPALLVVLVVFMVFGWLVLLPGEYDQLGRETAEGAGFVRDLSQYWRRDDLLRVNRVGIDLGHLWSLGVEEQFYLLWPPLLVIALKLPKWRPALIAITTAVSFAVNICLSSKGHGAAYFIPLPRLWELSIGGALAYIESERDRNLESRSGSTYDTLLYWSGLHNRHVRGFIGAALISAALARLDSVAFFPGWQALAPCMGSFLLISSGPQSWINRYVLTANPLVFIGLISYPIYLWHYPILEIPRLLWGDVKPVMTVGAVATTFLLAFFTYRCIELPIRSSPRTTAVAGILCTAMLGCIAIGSMAYLHVIPARPQPLSVSRFLQTTTEDWLPGTHNTGWTSVPDGLLTLGTAPHRVLYIGDSNMQQYYPRIKKLLAEHPQNRHGAAFAVRDRCAPGAFEIADLDVATRDDCRKFLRTAFEYANGPAVDTVVIGGCWACYFSLEDLVAGTTGHLAEGSDRALASLKLTITELIAKGKRVFVILNLPMGIDLDPHQMVRRTIFYPGFKISGRKADKLNVTNAVQPIVARIKTIARLAGATAIDPIESLCDQTTCASISSAGESIYHDWWNLSPAYVRDSVRFLDGTVLDDSDANPVSVLNSTQM